MSLSISSSLHHLLDEARENCGMDEGAAAVLEFLASRIAEGAIIDRSREITGSQAEDDLLVTSAEIGALVRFHRSTQNGGSQSVPNWQLNQLSRIGLATPVSGGYKITPAGQRFLSSIGESFGKNTSGGLPEAGGAGDDPIADYDTAFHEFTVLPPEARDALTPVRALANATLRVCARSHPEAMYLASDVHKVLVALNKQMHEAASGRNTVITVTQTPVQIDFDSEAGRFREMVTAALLDAGAPFSDDDGKLLSVVDQIRWIAGLSSVGTPTS